MRYWLASGKSQGNQLNLAVTCSDLFLPLSQGVVSCEQVLVGEAHFSCLLGVPACHFYKSVFIGLIIADAEPDKGDCDCNI